MQTRHWRWPDYVQSGWSVKQLSVTGAWLLQDRCEYHLGLLTRVSMRPESFMVDAVLMI